MKRSDIDRKYKWDLSAIFATEEDYEREYSEVLALISGFPRHESVMTSSAEELYSALSELAEIEKRAGRIFSYASLSYYVDTRDPIAQARNAKSRDLAQKADEATWFVSPRLLSLDGERLREYFSECPELSRFRRLIDKNMRYKPHTLSDECEELMTRLGDCLGLHSDVRSTFAISDLTFGKIRDENGKTVTLADTNYIKYMMSSDRRVRRSAFKTLYKTYDQFKNTFAALYYNHVKEETTRARVRGFESSIVASTFADEVTPEIYNNLIATVNKSLPKLFEYYELKREVLGLSKLHMYDIYTPLLAKGESREYTYEQACSEVLRMAEIFGEEYHSVMKRGLTERGWVDVYPSEGKRGGAFSAATPGTEPYILMNFNGTAEDVSTLAHEGGHSMHSYYSQGANEAHNSRYTLFVAEVASTVNELLLMHMKLRESESREEKLDILNQLMELYKSTLYRQTMLAEFERDAHAAVEAGKPLTAEVVDGMYYDTVKRYFGKDVVCDGEIALEWMRIPHFYMTFYVYKYATCISAASAIVKRIETEGESYISQYIDFLRCGGSKSPLDSLKVAGIDMARPEVVDVAAEEFALAVSEFKKLYGESVK